VSAYEQYQKFISTLFTTEDTLCFCAIDPNKKLPTLHDFVGADFATSEAYFTGLTNLSATYNVYVAMNPFKAELRRQKTGRKKENVAEVKRLYIDVDENGEAVLQQIQNDDGITVPPPNVVLNSSPGKYQFIWNVSGLNQETAEAQLKGLASKYSGDPAVAEVARVLRVPGFVNRKYSDLPVVSVIGEMIPHVFTADDFNLEKVGTATRVVTDVPPGFQEVDCETHHTKNPITGAAFDKIVPTSTPEEQLAQFLAAIPNGGIPYHSHDTTLTSVAGYLRHYFKQEPEEMNTHLVEVCERCCVNHGTDYQEMCKKIAYSIGRREIKPSGWLTTTPDLGTGVAQPAPGRPSFTFINGLGAAIEAEAARVGIQHGPAEEFEYPDGQPETRWKTDTCIFEPTHTGSSYLFYRFTGGAHQYGYHCDVESCAGNYLEALQKKVMGFMLSGAKGVDLGTSIKRALRNGGPREAHPFDYEGIVPSGSYCLWLGAMKAEKSLFALRKAMHDACGKRWLNCHNLLGPVEVIYFDSENEGNEVDDRWDEIISEFEPHEQMLIKQNLHLIKGKKIAREDKISIDYDNTLLWTYLSNLHPNAKVVYLDCWYQLQSIKATDAATQKLALERFEEYFPGRTLFLLHHTGRETNESLQKKKPVGLRELGAERWSNRVSQSIVVLKKADLIICQEKRFDLDDEGVKQAEFVDVLLYSRSGPGTPLLTFEPVYGDDQGEYKYRRKMMVALSTSAASILDNYRTRGPWRTKYELAKEMGAGGRQYHVIAELLFKGFLVHDSRGYWFRENVNDVIADASQNTLALKKALAFLKRILATGPMPEDTVKAMARTEGVLLASPTCYDVRCYKNPTDGAHYWSMDINDEQVALTAQIKTLIAADTTVTKIKLAEQARCSDRQVDNAIVALGLTKPRGRKGTWQPTVTTTTLIQE
jgi:RepB DNA-primase from phage plasmid/AAA domain